MAANTKIREQRILVLTAEARHATKTAPKQTSLEGIAEMLAYDMTLRGGLTGEIWMPAVTCGKDITIDLAREAARFTEKPTMRELLLHVLMEHGGDFQSASFTGDTEIEVCRVVVSDGRRRTVSRYWPITAFKSVTDLVEVDVFSGDFHYNEDDDYEPRDRVTGAAG